MNRGQSLSILLLVGMAIGFILDVGLVIHFGFSGQVDRFILALTIPILLDMLFRESIRNVLVPHFTSLHKHGSPGEVMIYAKRLATSALLIGLGFSLLLALGAGLLHAFGIHSHTGGSGLPVLLALLSPLPALAFPATIGAVYSNARSRFSIFGLRMLIVYGCGLVGLLWAILSGEGVGVVAVGYVAGFGSYAALSLQQFRGVSLGGQSRWLTVGELRELYEMTRLMFAAFGLRASVRYLERMIVFPMGEGFLAGYYLAFRVFSSLQSVIGMVASTTRLPSLSRLAQAGRIALLFHQVKRGSLRVAALALIAGGSVAILSTRILDWVVGRGLAEGLHESLAVQVFYVFALALPAACVTPVLSSGLFALDRRGDVFATMLLTSSVHVLLILALGYAIGVFGVAFAVVVSSLVSVIALHCYLGKAVHAAGSHASG
jgi:peptidoglycan biosynthesis protein MviN/MurJ (putative lipid II flippase)